MRKNPSTSLQSAIEAAVNAAKPAIEPPAHVKLRPDDRPFWLGIVCARARNEWTDADLVVAAQLARCQRDIETESVVLDTEGSVVENQRGTMCMNPRVTVLEQLARREMALMRTLRLAGATVGPPTRDLQQKRGLERQARALADEKQEDDLLA